MSSDGQLFRMIHMFETFKHKLDPNALEWLNDEINDRFKHFEEPFEFSSILQSSEYDTDIDFQKVRQDLIKDTVRKAIVDVPDPLKDEIAHSVFRVIKSSKEVERPEKWFGIF